MTTLVNSYSEAVCGKMRTGKTCWLKETISSKFQGSNDTEIFVCDPMGYWADWLSEATVYIEVDAIADCIFDMSQRVDDRARQVTECANKGVLPNELGPDVVLIIDEWDFFLASIGKELGKSLLRALSNINYCGRSHGVSFKIAVQSVKTIEPLADRLNKTYCQR